MNTQPPRDLTKIADALKQQAGTPRVPVLLAERRPRWWRYGMVRDLHGQRTIVLDPRLLTLGLQAIRATIAHELGHIALGHRFGRSSERWTRRDDALAIVMPPLSVAIWLAITVPLAWSVKTLIIPLLLGAAAEFATVAHLAPWRQRLEYEADAYAIRLLGERDSTIGLLGEADLAPAPRRLKHLEQLEQWMAWRLDPHPPANARIEHARNVPLPTTLEAFGGAAHPVPSAPGWLRRPNQRVRFDGSDGLPRPANDEPT